MFASSRFSGFFANGSTVVLVALLVIALFVIILLSGLLCSRCKASSRPMNSAEPQTIEITRFSSDDLGNGKFTGHGDDHTERKKNLLFLESNLVRLHGRMSFPKFTVESEKDQNNDILM